MADNDNIKRLLQGLEAGDDTRAGAEMRDLYADAPRSFSPGFADRIAEHVQGAGEEKGVDYFLPQVFKWFAVTGIAAAVALLLLTYLSQDSISIDALSGLSEVSLAEAESLDI